MTNATLLNTEQKANKMQLPFLPTSEENFADVDASIDDWHYPIDLNRLMLPRPASSFLLRASHEKKGVKPGDILVVDRSLTPHTHQLVVAVSEGELRLDSYPVGEVWGVVTHVIRSMR